MCYLRVLEAALVIQNMKSSAMDRVVQSGQSGLIGQSVHSHVMGAHKGEKESVFFQERSLPSSVLVQKMRRGHVTKIGVRYGQIGQTGHHALGHAIVG